MDYGEFFKPKTINNEWGDLVRAGRINFYTRSNLPDKMVARVHRCTPLERHCWPTTVSTNNNRGTNKILSGRQTRDKSFGE